MQEALIRIGVLQQTGKQHAGNNFAKRYALVIEARNAVAHSGHIGGLVADEVAELAVRGVDSILRLMNRTLADVFGEYTAAATALLDEHGTKVEQRVALLLGRAQQAFQERGAGLHPDRRATELDTADKLTDLSSLNDDGKLPAPCPACQRLGILTGSPMLEIEPDEFHTDEDGRMQIESVSVVLTLSTDGFNCPACGLRLHGQEELAEAGLPAFKAVRPGTTRDLDDYLGDPSSGAALVDEEGADGGP